MYLQMGALYNQVSSFIGQNLRPETAVAYLAEATVYADEKLQAAAVKTIGSDYESLLAASQTLSLETFKFCISSATCGSKPLSKIVVAFCEKRENEIDSELLQLLTDRTRMPILDPSAAAPLLKLSLKHLTGQPAVEVLDRCLEAAAPHGRWENMLLQKEDAASAAVGAAAALAAVEAASGAAPADGAAAAAVAAAAVAAAANLADDPLQQVIASLPMDLENRLLRKALAKAKKQQLEDRADIATIGKGLARTGIKDNLREGRNSARKAFDQLWRRQNPGNKPDRHGDEAHKYWPSSSCLNKYWGNTGMEC